ncbi:hypothetical protein CRG98_032311 [Punica granatum]|uniref:Uncharacterized protein n=1 Tax=Punica granatum TaxID=22663 RepID=A0A2I0ITH1_PUNGR|nr:hypothetical protein CRG98_032311 [Punica granatum]
MATKTSSGVAAAVLLCLLSSRERHRERERERDQFWSVSMYSQPVTWKREDKEKLGRSVISREGEGWKLVCLVARMTSLLVMMMGVYGGLMEDDEDVEITGLFSEERAEGLKEKR